MKNDEPRCQHNPGFERRVTNLPDGEPLRMEDPHRSAWVCSNRACVLDAMAWVERGTGQTALMYDRDQKLVTL